MTQSFAYEALPMHVTFGNGSIGQLAAEVDRLGVERIMVLASTRQAADLPHVFESLGARIVSVYGGAAMHVPIEAVHDAQGEAERCGADVLVAIGGGSTIGLSKALARDSGIPIVAVPTTYSGSEMTPVWGITTAGVKTTGRDRRVLPTSVIYDPDLTLSMPTSLRVVSSVNAIAHAVEGLYAPDRSPITSLMAEEGARALIQSLAAMSVDPDAATAPTDALYGAWLCGAVLGATTMSLHHKICHVLGGAFGLPHGDVHTIVLPYVLAYNEGHAPDAMASLRRASGSPRPAEYLRELSLRLASPSNLVDIGFDPDGIEHVVQSVTSNPYANPRPVTTEAVRAIVRSATFGSPVANVR